MKTIFGNVRRFAFGAVALAVGVAVGLPALTGSVSAAGQVSTRSVMLSNSTPSAAATKYTVSFKPATTGTIGGIIVDFCGDSPIIGSTTCTLPTAFTLGTAVTLTAGYTGMGTGWTASGLQGGAAASNNQVAVLTTASAQSVTAGSAVTFELTGITNPSSTGTFYARIYTFTTSTTAANYTATGTARVAAPVGVVDYGGAALSTTAAISVSATVQEQLTFCVSKAAPAAGCTSLTTPNVVLGSGTPTVLGTALSTDTVYNQVTTNAVSGVSIALKNTSSTTCAGLSRDGGATCPIAAVGSGTAAAAISTGDGVVGVRVAAGTGTSGATTPAGIYNATTYSMRTQTYGNYGDPIAASTGATTDVNTLMTYGAAAAATTPAGVYTATHSLIATGTY
jgi:hypothetical protein